MKFCRTCSIILGLAVIFISCKAAKDIIPKASTLNVQQAIQIDTSPFGFGVCEPTICINPTNKDEIAAGSILDWFYKSKDGGLTWEKSTLKSPYGVYGDPVVRIDYNGNIFYSHLSNPDNAAYRSESFLDRIVVQRSTDFGNTWNDGTYPEVRGSKDQDKQWMSIQPGTNHLAMTWTEFDTYGSKEETCHSRILFSNSTDSGNSWSKPKAISQFEGNCIDDDQTTEGAVPSYGFDDNLYVAWSYDEHIYFDKSEDGGKTWLEIDKVIADQPEGWNYIIPGINRCNGMPITGFDYSNGEFRGRIYVNWSDQRNGINDTDVWLIYSDDKGESWSKPKKVNDDNSKKHQFFTWMDIDPKTGFIYIVFYDRRESTNEKTDVFLAFSTDGGLTFTNTKINSKSFTPSDQVFFGDYNDISAFDGRIRPIWTQLEGIELSVWTAIIDINQDTNR
jgi:Neuraminidase (sialidase)